MSIIWDDQSIQSKAELLVLLALADFANDKYECWPSIESLALKARCTQRAAQTIISRLNQAGIISVEYNAGPHNTNKYKLLMAPPNAVHPEPSCLKKEPKKNPKKKQLDSPEPSGTISNHQYPSGTEIPSSPAGEVETLKLEMDEPTPKEESPTKQFTDSWYNAYQEAFNSKYFFRDGADGKAVKQLLDIGEPVVSIIDKAKRAWKIPGFLGQTSRTIVGFLSKLNEINAELAMPTNRMNGNRQISPLSSASGIIPKAVLVNKGYLD